MPLTLSQFRKQYPQYDDMSDEQVINNLHSRYYSDIPMKEFREKLEAPKENTSNWGVRGLQRGLGSIVEGVGDIVEDLPGIAATAIDQANPVTNALSSILPTSIKPITDAVAPTYKSVYRPLSEGLQEAGQSLKDNAGPRHFGSASEALARGDYGEALGSAAETLIESGIPTIGGLALGAATRNPAVAGAFMAGTIFPQEYGEIRGMQDETGEDDVDLATKTAALASALDFMFGSNPAARGVGQAAKEALKLVPKKILKTAGTEAITELAQTAIERHGGGADLTSEEALRDMADSFIVGALGGGVTSAAVEGLNRVLPEQEEQTPSEEAPTLEPTQEKPQSAAALLNEIKAPRTEIATRLKDAVGEDVWDDFIIENAENMARVMSSAMDGDPNAMADAEKFIDAREAVFASNTYSEEREAATTAMVKQAREILREVQKQSPEPVTTAPNAPTRKQALEYGNHYYGENKRLADVFYAGATGHQYAVYEQLTTPEELEAYKAGVQYMQSEVPQAPEATQPVIDEGPALPPPLSEAELPKINPPNMAEIELARDAVDETYGGYYEATDGLKNLAQIKRFTRDLVDKGVLPNTSLNELEKARNTGKKSKKTETAKERLTELLEESQQTAYKAASIAQYDYKQKPTPVDIDENLAWRVSETEYPGDVDLIEKFYRGVTGKQPDNLQAKLTLEQYQAYQKGRQFAAEWEYSGKPPENPAAPMTVPEAENPVENAPAETPTPTEEKGGSPPPPPPPPPTPPHTPTPQDPGPQGQADTVKVNKFKRKWYQNATVNWLAERFNYDFQPGYEHDLKLAEHLNVEQLPVDYSLDAEFSTYKSRLQGLANDLSHKYDKPISDIIIGEKFTTDEMDKLGLYLWFKAAPYHNAIIAERNPGKFITGGSGVTNKEAADGLAKLETDPKFKQYVKIGETIQRAVDDELRIRVKSGLLDYKTMKEMRARQPFYVPLRGYSNEGNFLLPDETVEVNPEFERMMQEKDVFKRFTELSRPRSVLPMQKTKEFFTARGRDNTAPFHPLFNWMEDHGRLARRAALQPSAIKLMNNAEALPDFYKDTVVVYDKEHPMFTRNEETFGDTGTQTPLTEQAMIDKVKSDPTDRFLIAKRNGFLKIIEFKNTPEGTELRRLFMNAQTKEMDAFFKHAHTINRRLKQLLTTRNPIYQMFMAWMRDTVDAFATALHNSNVPGAAAFGKKLASRMGKELTKGHTWQNVYHYAFGTGIPENMSPERRGDWLLLQQFIRDGGAPVWGIVEDNRTAFTRISNQLKTYEKALQGNVGAKAVLTYDRLCKKLDDFAELNDLFPRFATYKAALKEGLSRNQAAQLALDSSLDLTRRGTWSKYTDLLPFFSPGVEGSRKTMRAVSNPRTIGKLIAPMMMLGVLESAINDAVSGDENDDGTKDYLSINSGIRSTRLAMYWGPGGDDYVKIPIGMHVGYFKFMGNMLYDGLLTDNMSTMGMSTSLWNATKDLGVNMIGLLSPARLYGGDVQTVLSSIMPLHVKPIAEVVNNKNYFGNDIYNPAYPNDVKSELGRATTSEFWKTIARGINSVTLGSAGTSGVADFQPEIYEYILGGYLGGPYQLGEQIVNWAEDSWDNPRENFANTKKIPFVKSFRGNGIDYAPKNKYQKFTKEIAQLYKKRPRETGGETRGLSPERWAKEMQLHPLETNPHVLELYGKTENAVRKIYEDQKEDLQGVTDPVLRDTIKETTLIKVNREYNRFNNYITAIKD